MIVLNMTIGTAGLLVIMGVLAVFSFIASSQGDGSLKNSESEKTKKDQKIRRISREEGID